MLAKLQKLNASYRERGISGLAHHVVRSLVSSVCDYQVQEVRGRIIMAQDPPLTDREKQSHLAVECLILEAGASLEPFAGEFSVPFRDTFESLQNRLNQGCVLILARCAREDRSGKELAGYSIMEPGGFSAVGIKAKISKDILFVHHTEVARKYRGQRIAPVITRARNDYCRKHRITKSCNAHTTGNTPSERAFRKFGSGLLCYAVRVSFFRGLFVWHTPWRKIERAIAKLDADEPGRDSNFESRRGSRPETEIGKPDTKEDSIFEIRNSN